MSMDVNTWRAIPGYEGFYEVSTTGQVRSIDRIIQHRNGPLRLRGRVLAQHPDGHGYLTVSMSRAGVRRTMRVHALVIHAFTSLSPQDKLTI